jgi:hypothetical protein
VGQFAGKNDGARVFYRSAKVRVNRGVLQITATSMAYAIDNYSTSIWTGLRFYYMDHGEPTRNPFYFHGEQLQRTFFRFPMSVEDWMTWGDEGQMRYDHPPDYRPRYTFVRSRDGRGWSWSNDLHTTGWDLDLRVPFWLIFLALATPPGLMFLLKALRFLRRRRRRLRGLCARCGYDLRGGTSVRCPECGEIGPASLLNTRDGGLYSPTAAGGRLPHSGQRFGVARRS